MRLIAVTHGVVAAVVLWSGAVAQNNSNQPPPPSGSSAQTMGQADNNVGQPIRQAPIGHRQPRAKDVPSWIQENLGKRSLEDEIIDRKPRICRDC
jgi:hypothetical protein